MFSVFLRILLGVDLPAVAGLGVALRLGHVLVSAYGYARLFQPLLKTVLIKALSQLTTYLVPDLVTYLVGGTVLRSVYT